MTMRLTKMMDALKKYDGGLLDWVGEEKTNQIKNDPYYAKDLQLLRNAVQEMSGKPLSCIPYSYFKQFDETGSRTDFERVYDSHRRALSVFALSVLLDGTHLEDLENAIWALCDEYSWCLTAHFRYGGTNIPRIFNPAPRKDGKPDPYSFEQPYVVDLGAACTAAALSEVLCLLEDRLAPLVVHRARKVLMERIIEPFMAVNAPFWWETIPMNWAAVCANGVGVAAIYLIEDDEMLAPILTRCTQAMECYLDGFEADGVCAEGLGYWNYGFSHFVVYADLLKRRTNGEIDLFADELVHRVACFYQNGTLNENNAVCFSDCHDKARHQRFLVHYLHSVYGDVEVPKAEYEEDFSASLSDANRLLRDLFWSDPANDTDGNKPDGEALYQETQWAICRKTVDGASVGFAVKGGHNEEPHNHNDVGSYLLDIDGEVLLGDVGAGMYTRQYFSAERYDFLVNGSQGHPVPIINGKTQIEGKDARATVYHAEADEEKMTVYMEMAAAYGLEGLSSLERHVEFNKNSAVLSVADTYAFSGEPMAVTERIPTKVCPTLLDDGGVVIRGEKAAVKITCDVPCTWTITETEYPESSENLHQKAWLIDAAVIPASGDTVTLQIERV